MTIDAIYSMTPVEDWVKVAEKLNIEHNISPTYWITSKHAKKVQESFPKTVIHDGIDAIQGKFPEEYSELSYPIDTKIISKFQRYESIVLKMMDRMDPGYVNKDHFTYSERIRHYHRQLSYWLGVIDKIQPKVAIFGSTPHLIYDYILYAVCNEYDIETVIFTHTKLPKRFLVRKNVHTSPTIPQKKGFQDEFLPSELINHLQEVRGQYSEAQLEYMNGELNRVDKIKSNDSVQSVKRRLKRVFKIYKLFDDTKKYIKRGTNPIEDSQTKKWQKEIYDLKALKVKKKNLERYKKLTKEPNFSEDFVYFPLHFQPERTTSPEGDQFVHQNLALKLLSEAVKNDTQIYVKEHPAMFSSEKKGELGRYNYYYEDINEIPKTKLLPIATEPFSLIDESNIVSTVTGSTGWEALVRGTPVITFGHAWYSNAPGCYQVKSKRQLTHAINQCNKQGVISEQSINKFVGDVEMCGYHGQLTTHYKTNVAEFYDAICENTLCINNRE